METRNPYAPPASAVHDVVHQESPAGEDTLVPYGRVRPAGNGVEWIAAAWNLFKQRPGLWILAVVLGYGLVIALSMIPYLGLVTAVCSPLLTAGFVSMAHAAHRRELSGIGRLFDGFRHQTGGLLIVGSGYLVLWAATTLVMVMWDGPVWFRIVLGNADPQALEGRLLMFLAYGLITSALGLVILFAPALVMLNGVPPLAAIRMSLVGNAKNVLPGLVCAATFFPILVMSVIPLGLGLLVAVPLSFITIYTAYRDIFLESSG